LTLVNVNTNPVATFKMCGSQPIMQNLVGPMFDKF